MYIIENTSLVETNELIVLLKSYLKSDFLKLNSFYFPIKTNFILFCLLYLVSS